MRGKREGIIEASSIVIIIMITKHKCLYRADYLCNIIVSKCLFKNSIYCNKAEIINSHYVYMLQ